MKDLKSLLQGVDVKSIHGAQEATVGNLTYDSRSVGCGDCFFALRGTQVDGHRFIAGAVAAGASVIVCEQLPELCQEGVSYVVVEDSTAAMADIASAFYGNPSEELALVGVTGTNGKTTIATLLYDMFNAMGHPSGLISTVVYRIGERTIPSTHTTPDVIRLNQMLREMVDSGCSHCFMEVSSHSVVQQRIRGLKFHGAIFTNLTHDHLDYHGTFAEYIKAKKGLFDSLSKQAFAVVNVDDRNGEVMLQNTKAHSYRYSLRSAADFKCKLLEMHFDGMLLQIDGEELWVNFLGRFNASNLLAVYSAARLLGCEKGEVLRVMSMLRSVAGRFEPIRSANGITAIVDYAHTPDALENVIDTIDEIRREGNRLIVVCGCGGDRDATKRPEMGRIASDRADTVIFTSDNPRTEDPEKILDDVVAGAVAGCRMLRITDRSQAISTAAMLAQAGDIILIAGKGHEDYQIIGSEKIHFDDREQIRAAFEQLH